MEVTILGTGASEGIPAMFCGCSVCENARRKGGLEIRHRAGALIDNDTMIDFSPDTYALNCGGLSLTNLKRVLVTHTHSDHFCVDDLCMRSEWNILGGAPGALAVYGNSRVCGAVETRAPASSPISKIRAVELTPGQPQAVGGYTVVPFGTRHMKGEESLIFLLSGGGRHYLHCMDAEPPDDALYEYIRDRGIVLSLVVMDCTFGSMEETMYGHMNLRQNAAVRQKLIGSGLADERTLFVASHISHCGGDTHESLSRLAAGYGIAVAYDGMRIRL